MTKKNFARTGYLVLILAIPLIAACTHKGEPGKIGEPLTADQLLSLEKDKSMDGKLVMVTGYAAMCSRTSFVTAGKKAGMGIYPDGFCEGEALITANIKFAADSIQLSGEEERNYIKADKKFTNQSLMIMTDDYHELPNGKLKFSGTVIRDGSTVRLDNVTIRD